MAQRTLGRPWPWRVSAIVCVVSSGFAQRAQPPSHVGEVLAPSISSVAGPSSPRAAARLAGTRPAVMLTGYWPPTNEMLRRFSPSATQNPAGWLGADWEGRGYDLYAYFPEFQPPTCSACGPGQGDLEVDYQDTSTDFWNLANALQPIAIVTFSRGALAPQWELEMNQYNRSSWVDDYTAPFQPTPSPPDASVPAGFLRLSTLPVQEIVDNIVDTNVNVNPAICFAGNGGGFLSEFIAYHGVWYQALHSNPQDPAWCVAAGHVHVGLALFPKQAERATRVTLRTVLHHIDAVLDPTCQDVDLYCEPTGNSVGRGAQLWGAGSLSLGANAFGALLVEAPASSSALLFYGANRTQTPWGQGTLCVQPPLARVAPLFVTNADGRARFDLDFLAPPLSSGVAAISAGSTWNFQCAYRDSANGGSSFNSSNAIEATFCP